MSRRLTLRSNDASSRSGWLSRTLSIVSTSETGNDQEPRRDANRYRRVGRCSSASSAVSVALEQLPVVARERERERDIEGAPFSARRGPARHLRLFLSRKNLFISRGKRRGRRADGEERRRRRGRAPPTRRAAARRALDRHVPVRFTRLFTRWWCFFQARRESDGVIDLSFFF